jgi:hypothetical protein
MTNPSEPAFAFAALVVVTIAGLLGAPGMIAASNIERNSTPSKEDSNASN